MYVAWRTNKQPTEAKIEGIGKLAEANEGLFVGLSKLIEVRGIVVLLLWGRAEQKYTEETEELMDAFAWLER